MQDIKTTKIENGTKLYNEKEQVIAFVQEDDGYLIATIQQPNGNYKEVNVENLNADDWKVVTADDFEQGSFFWYVCLDEEETDDAEIDGMVYEEVFADALEIVKENHPESELEFDPCVQAGHGTIYLRDEANDTETSWDAQDEEEEFYDRLIGMTSYKAFVKSIANWLEARYEELEYDIYAHTDDPTSTSQEVLEQLKEKFAETFPNAEEELKVDTYRTLYEEDEDNTPDVVDSWYGIEPDTDLAGTIDFMVTYGEEGAMVVLIFADGHLAHYGCQDDNDDADIDQCIDALSMDVPEDDDDDSDDDFGDSEE